ncbi:cysteine hydrolase family protein [Ureibacillus sp. GCM10028918]|uniref:cysteine hydrolase family protein n=1 Tax=Ureibacillus sp. GCM10028918 TaxID=3273429 RepID=UPI003614E330
MNTALIIIDIQNDYFPNGKMELNNPEQAATNAAKALAWFRQHNKDNIFHVQHLANDPSVGFFLPDTDGAEIYASVAPLGTEDVTVKYAPNSFLNTDLEKKLKEKNITKLVVVGMMTHMCVDSTVRAAADLGFEVTVLENACTTLALSYNGVQLTAEQVHYSYMAGIHGVFAQVISTEDFLSQN